MRIRRARDEDAEEVHAVLRDAFAGFRPLYDPPAFDATVLDPQRVRARMAEGPVWVAEHDGRVVGTLSARTDGRGLYVRGMGVRGDARRLGVGRRLLETAEAYAREQGAPLLWLSTTPFLHGSIALYEALGFQHGAEGPARLHGTPLLSMEKRLE